MPDHRTFERREFLGLVGFLALAACSSSAKKSSSPGPTVAGTTPTPSATPSSAVTSSTRPGPSSPTTVFVSNTALDRAILASDADTYNGAWHGQWAIDGGPTGDVAGTITIDPDARTLVATVDGGGHILGGAAIPPFTVTGSVDSFAYNADTGAFRIQHTTAVGIATLTNGNRPGEFVLSVVDIPGHPDIAEFRATGVANRPDAIPVRFEIDTTGGAVRTGSLTLHPG